MNAGTGGSAVALLNGGIVTDFRSLTHLDHRALDSGAEHRWLTENLHAALLPGPSTPRPQLVLHAKARHSWCA